MLEAAKRLSFGWGSRGIQFACWAVTWGSVAIMASLGAIRLHQCLLQCHPYLILCWWIIHWGFVKAHLQLHRRRWRFIVHEHDCVWQLDLGQIHPQGKHLQWPSKVTSVTSSRDDIMMLMVFFLSWKCNTMSQNIIHSAVGPTWA